jgi:hypothetical protein
MRNQRQIRKCKLSNKHNLLINHKSLNSPRNRAKYGSPRGLYYQLLSVVVSATSTHRDRNRVQMPAKVFHHLKVKC